VKFADGVRFDRAKPVTQSTDNQPREAAWSWPADPQHWTITRLNVNKRRN